MADLVQGDRKTAAAQSSEMESRSDLSTSLPGNDYRADSRKALLAQSIVPEQGRDSAKEIALQLRDLADSRVAVDCQNPAHTIYLVKEFHPAEDQLSKEIYERVVNLQQRIASIGERVLDRLQINTLYKDSYTDERVKERQIFRSIEASLTDNEKGLLSSDAGLGSLMREFRDLETSNDRRERIASILAYSEWRRENQDQAIHLIEGRRAISIRESESRELVDGAKRLAIEAVRNGQSPDELMRSREWIDNKNLREDYLVQKLLSGGGANSLVIMGYAHDLRDNLLRHNANHPASKIRLIEIEPHGISEIAKLIR